MLESLKPPSVDQMAGSSGIAKRAAADWRWYSRSCERSYQAISAILEIAFKGDLSGKKVLDWGSALGGVALLMDARLPVEVTAADVDKHSIAWIRKTNTTVRAATLEPAAELPFDDSAFDAAFGISVLTHIPPHLQEFYLAEIARVVARDGVAVLSLKSYESVDDARLKNKDPSLHPHTREQLDDAGILYAPYPDSVLKRMDFTEHSDYGITYHSPDYIEETFGKCFTFETELNRQIGDQIAYVLRPKK